MINFTFQDLLSAGESNIERAEFCLAVSKAHKESREYQDAKIAEDYYAGENTTIKKYKKLVASVRGRLVPDTFSPNHKLSSGFFRRFVTQQTQYVLSNGVTFQNKAAKSKLGKDFDYKLQRLAKKAMINGTAFGFWNGECLDVFSLVDTKLDTAFAPLYDAHTGELRAGVRFWEFNEVLNLQLFEEDGITLFCLEENLLRCITPKTPYIKVVSALKDGSVIDVSYNNFAKLPIFPLYANDLHRSELLGIRSAIDCYDFIKSGMANSVDEASSFYWIIQNAGGMDNSDLLEFVQKLKEIKAVSVQGDDGVSVDAHTLAVPTEASEKLLDRLRSDLYEDFMLLDTEKALSGNMTATAIRLSYQAQDDKCGEFEYQIRDFLNKLLPIVGIEDEPSFKWNRIANQNEETQMVINAAAYLDDEAILNHLPWLTPEEVSDILDRREINDDARMLRVFSTPEAEE